MTVVVTSSLQLLCLLSAGLPGGPLGDASARQGPSVHGKSPFFLSLTPENEFAEAVSVGVVTVCLAALHTCYAFAQPLSMLTAAAVLCR